MRLPILLAGLFFLAGVPTQGAAEEEKVYVFDLWKFFEEEKIGDTLDRADFTYLVTALQGIANRDEPRLYILASLCLIDVESRLSTHKRDEIEITDIDRFWLDHLLERGEVKGDALVRTNSLATLLEEFKDELDGLALWEAKNPATVNAALTAASVRNLLPVSNDLGGVRLKAWLRSNAPFLETKLDLTGKFTDGEKGKGVSFGGTVFPSSGSAKTDVYHFIHEAFVKTEGASPFFIYYNSDAAMWGGRRKMYNERTYGHLGDRNELQQNGMFNNDYWIAKRGLFVDLYVWDDHAPNDDPQQPLGADWKAWNDILETGYRQRKGEFGVVGGFVPWWIKYADEVHDDVSTEWRFIDLITSYNMANDADAAFGISNASFFMHLPAVEREKIPSPPTGAPPLKDKAAYLTFYMLDYDGSAWLNQAAEAIYAAEGRGRIPLNWAVNPILNERVPHAFRYMVENATEMDFFGIEDDGAGYISPYRLVPGQRIGRIRESGIPFYERYAKAYHDRYRIALTPYYVTPAYHTAWGEMAARLTPEGFGMNIPSPLNDVNGTPVMTPESFHVNRVDDLRKFVEQLHRDSAAGHLMQTQFFPVRTIMFPPHAIADAVADARRKFPGGKVEVVDAFTFHRLRKDWLGKTLEGPFRDRAKLTATPAASEGLRTAQPNVANEKYGRFQLAERGLPAWLLRGDPAQSRLFFQIDQAFAQENFETDCRVTVEYRDEVAGKLAVEFVRNNREGVPISYANADPGVKLAGNKGIKRAIFRLKAPHFVQGMHYRSDFCITAPADTRIYSVKLETQSD